MYGVYGRQTGIGCNESAPCKVTWCCCNQPKHNHFYARMWTHYWLQNHKSTFVSNWVHFWWHIRSTNRHVVPSRAWSGVHCTGPQPAGCRLLHCSPLPAHTGEPVACEQTQIYHNARLPVESHNKGDYILAGSVVARDIKRGVKLCETPKLMGGASPPPSSTCKAPRSLQIFGAQTQALPIVAVSYTRSHQKW